MIGEHSEKLSLQPHSWTQRFFYRFCEQLNQGLLELETNEGTFKFGRPSDDHLQVKVIVNNPKAYNLLMTMGSNGAAEAFIRGYWTTDNLTGLIQLLLRNRAQLDGLEGGVASIASAFSKVGHYLNRNTPKGSQRNIAAHYDLGNEFFALFLDRHMMYSSAVYRHQNQTLDEASEYKMALICKKLGLKSTDHLMEIGSGWGGFAVFAAKHYGCRVTTTTISQEQYLATQQRVVAAGLDQRVTVLKRDYRKLSGRFDKLVSIEMVEAVGHHYLNDYFKTIRGLLKPDGKALIQAITIEDDRYWQALRTVDYIKRYIFPGSFIPCVCVLANSAANARLRLYNLEDIGASYAQTLLAWATAFNLSLDAVREQGFDERFVRMWQFYLSYCEGGFREQAISAVQLVFTPTGIN